MGRHLFFAAALAAPAIWAQQPSEEELKLEHANCIFFGANTAKYNKAASTTRRPSAAGILTEQVTARLAPVSTGFADFVPGGSRTDESQTIASLGAIDRYLFQAMADQSVTPAGNTNDFEFIRRVTLDLSGRIPTPTRVQSFVADVSSDKRAKLIDELLAKPEYVDKWTMFLGDLLKNNSRNTQVSRFPNGTKAFYTYIKNAIAANKPYDQMAREMIAAQGSDSYTQGELNFLVGAVVTGGPVQDVFDAQTVAVFQTFLGLAHVNCILCHNGRGHLDSLSLWGSTATRTQGWQLASFLSHTQTSRTPVSGAPAGTPYYWGLEDNTRYRTDYTLNTTTGNRPTRAATSTQRTVAPVYVFNGRKPSAGENYRTVLAREVTADFQFARASVNYVWAEMFGKGLVDPVDQFDPARLDPDNPPPAPWTLQPSNSRLLNALAQDFIASRYDFKGLLRQIANTRAYQLSSRYNGAWNASWENLFARKLVRRLWAEEVHDAVVQSSNIVPAYNTGNYGTLSWAMQFPEPLNTPGNSSATASITALLDAFLRGNRDDEDRRQDGSISQALNLMNDAFVMSRVSSAASAGANSLLVKSINLTDDQLVSTLFLNVLSRYPTDAEKAVALNSLKSNRTQEAENLLWSLYNKVDFVFNY